MKRTLILLIAIIFVCSPVFAGEIIFEEDDSPKAEVTFDYWIAEFSYDHETANQNFLPSLTAAADFRGPWSGSLQYHDSKSSTTEAGEQVESKRYALAVQYDFEEGYFVTFGYQKMEYNISTAGVPGGADISGVRLGVGFDYEPVDEPWMGTLEFGVGITNNADVVSAGVAEEVDADTYDILARIKYYLQKDGMFANAGYRYVSTRYNIQRVGKTNTVKGPFLGIGYEW